MSSMIEVLKEVSLELKNGTLGKDLELGHIEQLLEIGIYKLQKKGYFKNKKALLALEQKDKLKVWLEKRIRITKTEMRNEINLQIICGKGGKLKAYKEVLELMK
jgi:hypothetical protein